MRILLIGVALVITTIGLMFAFGPDWFKKNKNPGAEGKYVEIRPRITLEWENPGEITDADIQVFFLDTTAIYYGDNFELRLAESNTIEFKKANFNYESEALKIACGASRSYRQSDFVENMTGAVGSTSSYPLEVNGYNACITFAQGQSPDMPEGEFAFTLMIPFYSFSAKGPLAMKGKLLKTLRSFTFYDIDPELTKPNTRKVPEKFIKSLRDMLYDQIDAIIDTEVIMVRDDEENIDDIMNPTCRPNTIPNPGLGINVGLTSPSNMTIRRDGYVPLSALAEDLDQLHLFCQNTGDCGAGSTLFKNFFSPVELTWQVREGDASFVQVGCLPENQKKATGNSVILRPPVILKDKETKTVSLRLLANDGGYESPVDDGKIRDIKVTFTGKSSHRNQDVLIDVEVSGDRFTPINIPEESKEEKPCKLEMEIKEIDKLETPEIVFPSVSLSHFLVYGQKVTLSVAPQEDLDILEFGCISNCDQAPPRSMNLHDEIIYKWTIKNDRGHFEVNGKKSKTTTGTSVIYNAPGRDHDIPIGNVNIEVIATNLNGDFKDQDSDPGKAVISIFRPAIMITDLPENWEPEYQREVEVKFKLGVFTDYNSVEPTLSTFDHVSTLFNIELDDVTKYNGICTNWDSPFDKEEDKLDIFFLDDHNQANFWSTKQDPKDETRRTYSRMKSPVKGTTELALRLTTMDYAAYASLELRYLDKDFWEFEEATGHFPIPKDDNMNKVADHLPHDRAIGSSPPKYKTDRDDEDIIPAQNRGDGFTAWEEYRGFMLCNNNENCTESVYRRTSPLDRDLMVYSTEDFTFEIFANASDINVHRLESGDYYDADTRIVNNQASNLHLKGGDQYCIFVTEGKALFRRKENNGRTFWTFPETTYAQTNLKHALKIEINLAKINNANYNAEEVLAHEMAHAARVPHHGEGKSTRKGPCVKNPYSETVCFNEANEYQPVYRQAGTINSGNLLCLMRYEQMAVYEDEDSIVEGCNDDCDGIGDEPDTHLNLALIFDAPDFTRVGNQLRRRQIFCRDFGEDSPWLRVAEGAGNCYNRINIKCWE